MYDNWPCCSKFCVHFLNCRRKFKGIHLVYGLCRKQLLMRWVIPKRIGSVNESRYIYCDFLLINLLTSSDTGGV